MKLSVPLLISFPVLLYFIASGCASRDDSVAPDLEAPIVTVFAPAAGDSVGIDSLVVIFQAADDIGVIKAEISINDEAPAATLPGPPWKAVIPIASYPDGNHTVKVAAHDGAGNVTSKSVPFVKALRTEEQVWRIVLVELVTSANCVPCAPANEAYHLATDNDFYRARLATIKNHAWFPRSSDSLWRQSQAWARPRIEYLFHPIPIANASAPNGWVDGAAAGSSAQGWINALNANMTVPPDVRIDLAKKDSAGGVSLSVTVKPLTAYSGADLRLHTVVTENDIEYNDGNAENIHYDVMRMMLPDADGERVTLAPGATLTRARFISFAPIWVRSNLSVIVFVQDHSTKKVLQAAKMDLK